MVRGVNGLDIYYTATVEYCCICDSLKMVCQMFVNSLYINVKTSTVYLKLMKFRYIVVVEYIYF